ncbi:hypothetical protein PILCRDRAFT_62207, partial [Piloderma croceum F 1598]
YQEFLKCIVRYRITVLYLVSPMFVLLCKDPIVKKYDLGHVRTTNSGAAPFPIEVIQQLSRVSSTAIRQGYGCPPRKYTLIPFIMQGRLKHPLHTKGVGVLLPGIVARVVNPDGSLARAGETGELHLRTPSLALDYSNNERASFECPFNKWFHTGDEVKFDEQGELYVVDRLKARNPTHSRSCQSRWHIYCVLTGADGFEVAPAELEGHLLDHEYVVDVCVVAVPNEYSGEVPFAFVVLHASLAKKTKSNPQETNITSFRWHVVDHKTKYKWLEGGVEFIDNIPKTASGKLLRRTLRDRARCKDQAQSKL